MNNTRTHYGRNGLLVLIVALTAISLIQAWGTPPSLPSTSQPATQSQKADFFVISRLSAAELTINEKLPNRLEGKIVARSPISSEWVDVVRYLGNKVVFLSPTRLFLCDLVSGGVQEIRIDPYRASYFMCDPKTGSIALARELCAPEASLLPDLPNTPNVDEKMDLSICDIVPIAGLPAKIAVENGILRQTDKLPEGVKPIEIDLTKYGEKARKLKGFFLQRANGWIVLFDNEPKTIHILDENKNTWTTVMAKQDVELDDLFIGEHALVIQEKIFVVAPPEVAPNQDTGTRNPTGKYYFYASGSTKQPVEIVLPTFKKAEVVWADKHGFLLRLEDGIYEVSLAGATLSPPKLLIKSKLFRETIFCMPLKLTTASSQPATAPAKSNQ